MEMTIDEAIKQLETYTIPCGKYKAAYDLAVETMRKYQKMQADYENRLKADMVAMLEELQLEIEEQKRDELSYQQTWNHPLNVCISIIQQKINSLGGRENEHI